MRIASCDVELFVNVLKVMDHALKLGGGDVLPERPAPALKRLYLALDGIQKLRKLGAGGVLYEPGKVPCAYFKSCKIHENAMSLPAQIRIPVPCLQELT